MTQSPNSLQGVAYVDEFATIVQGTEVTDADQNGLSFDDGLAGLCGDEVADRAALITASESASTGGAE